MTQNEVVEVVEVKQSNQFLNNLAVLGTPEGFQQYVLGTKSNGQKRALYDVVRDQQKMKKKKKKKKGKKHNKNTYDLYLSTSGPKKKKKKKKGKKHNKHWHI